MPTRPTATPRTTSKRASATISQQISRREEPRDFEDADLTAPLEHQRVHGQQNDQETDHHSESDERTKKGLELGQAGGGHQGGVFGHGTNAVTGQKAIERDAQRFGIAGAPNVDHGNAFLGPGDLLRRFHGHKKPSALPVHDDAAHSEVSIHQRNIGADAQLASMCRQIVSDDVVGTGEGSAGEECKALAESVKSRVINSINYAEGRRIHDNDDGSDFVDSGKLFASSHLRLRDDGARKGKKYRGVRRLDDDVRSHAFGARAPIAQDPRGQANNQKNQEHLQADRGGAEGRAQRMNSQIAATINSSKMNFGGMNQRRALFGGQGSQVPWEIYS